MTNLHKENNNTPNKRGFTLIELLVVIAIISVLAAILFPVFARARENARRASCMSNLKQIGLGIMQYTQDYDEYYPMAWNGRVSTGHPGSFTQTQSGMPGAYFTVCDPNTCTGAGAGHFITWMDMIYPYVKSIQVFVCPSAQGELVNDDPGGHIPSYYMSGAYSNFAFQKTNSDNAGDYAASKYGLNIVHSGTPAAGVVRPSETIMMVDINNHYGKYSLALGPRAWPQYAESAEYHASFIPHLEGTNVIYGDGHVKWKSLKSMESEIGPDDPTVCDLSHPTDIPYCNRSWNPFLP